MEDIHFPDLTKEEILSKIIIALILYTSRNIYNDITEFIIVI